MGMRPCSVNGIEFDALISESRSLTAEAPEYAVESGFSVSDNISIKPMVVEITANLTNTPVTWLDSHGTGRVETVVAQLENLYFSRQLVTVVTSTDTYRNMAITSLSVPKDTENMTSRDIRMTLKEITVVSSQTTTIPASYVRGGDTGANAGTSGTGNRNSSGSGAASGGTGSGKSESEDKASILYNFLNN
ncbi:MAG: hypothetical protein HFI60_02165 [Lachnospiraceae bacterium]|jgi:uncharacterized membrane protein YgcG|nr:hypothetical protein [Lachnospiraceae bacterium]